jgi:hypothetical protein
MNLRDVIIGSSIIGMFSYTISAIVFLFSLKGDSNFTTIVKNAFTTFQTMPFIFGLIVFLVFFSHYSLVDILPSTWELNEKWEKKG